MAPIIISSSRGKDLLLLENYTFTKGRLLKSGEVFWRCIQKRYKCTAKVYTTGPELTITRSELVHTHEANPQKICRQLITNACKRKTEDNISEKPSNIIRKVLSANLPAEITETDVNYIRRNLHNSRKRLPRLPTTNIHEVHDTVDTSEDRSSKRKKTVPSNNLPASEKDASQLKVVALSRKLPDTIDPGPEASTKTYTWVKNDVTGPEAEATKGIKIFQGNSEIPIVKVVVPYAKDINKPAIPITLKPILPRPVNFDGNCPVNFDGNSPINFDGNLLQNILRTSSTQHDDTSNNCEQFSYSETKRQKIENIETDESASNFNYNFHSQNTNVLNEKEQPEKELYKERRKVILLQKEVSRLKTLVFKLQKIISDKL